MTELVAAMQEWPTVLPGLEGGRPRRRALAGRLELPGSGRAADGVALLVVVAAVVATFWYVDRFAVNVVLSDQWADVGLIHQAHSGTLTLNSLWAQHNENRILFPDLVVLALAYTTHFNVVVEDYLNGALLVLSTVLVIVAHKRRSPLLHWIRYCPVVLALLSFDLLASALFGFQLSWFLVLFGLAAAISLLDRRDLTWPFLIASVVVAVVGSFSSLQGLFIWPAGLVLLYLRGRPKSFVLAWIVCAVVTDAVYFFHFDPSASGDSESYAFTHPLLAARVFFTTVGDGVGVDSKLLTTDTPGTIRSSWWELSSRSLPCGRSSTASGRVDRREARSEWHWWSSDCCSRYRSPLAVRSWGRRTRPGTFPSR